MAVTGEGRETSGAGDAAHDWHRRVEAIEASWLKRAVRTSLAAYRRGDFPAAAAIMASALERRLQGHMEIVAAPVLRRMPPLPSPCRILRREDGLSVELFRHRVCADEAACLIDYVLTLEARLPHRQWQERAYLRLRHRAVRVVHGGSSLAVKRRWLAVLAWLCNRILPLMAAGRAYRDQAAMELGRVLSEPRAAALALLEAHAFYRDYHYAKQLEGQQGGPGHEASGRFVWPERDAYRDFVRRCRDSRVLVTIHMGDFIGALGCLAAQVEPGRPVMSLRLERDDPSGRGRLAGQSIAQRVLRHGQYDPVEIISALRRGGQTLALFADLPASHGRTAAVRFFGRVVHLVRGPAELAIAGRAPIIPVVTYERHGRDLIEVGDRMDTATLPGESLAEATVRITQRIAVLMEQWIRRAPAQWQYLPSMFRYFESSGGVTDE